MTENICRLMDVSVLSSPSLAHDLHRAWQTIRGGGCEEGGTAKPSQERPEPQTGRLEEETSSASPLSQGAHAILEQAWPRTTTPRF
ncbi:hypothetical protein ANANG_G00152360 [Anguilla anguilla]|uniref:Uncharacterized protein n=1 Tax=Anguilla anguilla TaxID=7936 RepID=A0A9D3M8G6_ANGAN|nr:hypothetical protein ANANG_G00152360 [Anguilla anguilla]